MSTFPALPLWLFGSSFANISGATFRAASVGLGIVFFGYSSDCANSQDFVLFTEYNEIADGKVLVIRHEVVVMVKLARLVLVTIYAF